MKRSLVYCACLVLTSLVCTAYLHQRYGLSHHYRQGYSFAVPISTSTSTSTTAGDDLFFEEITLYRSSPKKSGISGIVKKMSLTEVLSTLRGILLGVDSTDMSRAADLQLHAIMSLVKSDEKNRDDDLTILYELPSEYRCALCWINDLCSEFANLRSSPGPNLYSLLKLLQKKENLISISKEVELDIGSMKSARDIVEIKRKIERSFSEVTTIVMAHNMLISAPGLTKDLLYFARPIIEKCNMHDRHYTLLLFCRGILAPVYRAQQGENTNGLENDIHSVVSEPFTDISTAFDAGMLFLNVTQPSVQSRLVFPFLLTFLRCHHGVVVDKLEPSCSVRNIVKNALSSGLEESTIKACLFLRQCMSFDYDAVAYGSVTDMGDDLLLSLRRWLCDSSAAYFINIEENEAIGPKSEDIIRRNTVAMELVLTERFFVKGKRNEREGFFLHCAVIGRVCDAVISSMTYDATGRSMKTKYGKLNMITTMKIGMSLYSISKYLGEKSSLRKKIEHLLGFNQVSSTDLPQKSGRTLEAKDDDSQLFSSDIIRQKTLPISSRLEDVGDSELWQEVSKQNRPRKVRRRGRMFTTAGNRPATEKDSHQYVQLLCQFLGESICELFRLSSEDRSSALESGKFREQLLYIYSTWRRPHLLLDYFRMHYSTPELQRVYKRYLKALLAISNETVDTIRNEDLQNRRHFSLIPTTIIKTWLEGKFSHRTNESGSSDNPAVIIPQNSSVLEILSIDSPQVNISNFLLSSVSNSFRIPKGFNGTTSKGKIDMHKIAPIEVEDFEYLPGYDDPQTLFMIGEDGNTCMSIRARQKGTNRGLLAYLVHGNCRILGVKDTSGKLVSRAVARLLIDEAIGIPAIYVEAAYGDLYDPTSGSARPALLEIFDQAAIIGRKLQIPVVYSTAPSENDYLMGPLEFDAGGKLIDGKSLVNLTDYSSLATHSWVDGLKHKDGSFHPEYPPSLHKIGPHGLQHGLVVGFRPAGSFESTGLFAKSSMSTQTTRIDLNLDSKDLDDELNSSVSEDCEEKMPSFRISTDEATRVSDTTLENGQEQKQAKQEISRQTVGQANDPSNYDEDDLWG